MQVKANPRSDPSPATPLGPRSAARFRRPTSSYSTRPAAAGGVHGSLDAGQNAQAAAASPSRRADDIRRLRREWHERQAVREHPRKPQLGAARTFDPYFGRRRLDQITVDDVAAFIAAMRRKGCTTIATALRLSRILSHAARRGAIPINPCSQLGAASDPSSTTNDRGSFTRGDAVINAADSSKPLPPGALVTRATDRGGARAHRQRPQPPARPDPSSTSSAAALNTP